MSERARIEDLAALAAVGDDAASAELDELAERDPEVAAVVAEYRDAAALLADTLEPVPPSPRAFTAIQAAVDRAADDDAADDPSPAPRPSQLHPKTRQVVVLAQRRASRASALAVFGFAAAAAFGVLWYRERDKMSDLRSDVAVAMSRAQTTRSELLDRLDAERDQREALDRALARLEARYGALRSPGLELATMRGDGGGTAKIFHDDASRRWVVFAFELPAVTDRDYQLWFVPADGSAPVSGGVLERAADGTLVGAPEVPANLVGKCKPAISVEPRGGSASPTMDQIKMIGGGLL